MATEADRSGRGLLGGLIRRVFAGVVGGELAVLVEPFLAGEGARVKNPPSEHGHRKNQNYAFDVWYSHNEHVDRSDEVQDE